MLYGTGELTYELVEGLAKLPEGWFFKDAYGVTIDAHDRVYVLN
jgi:hypothetical protein